MDKYSIHLRGAPPFILGAGLMMWGWQSNFLIYALFMAIIIEVPHWVHWRWPISDEEFNNLADLSGVAFFLATIYIFTNDGAKGIYLILALMPFTLFLLLLIQLYSEKGTIQLSALFMSLRRLEKYSSMNKSKRIDLSLPYLILCLVSASAGDQRTLWFFVFVCLVIGIVLWTSRPGRYKLIIWSCLIIASVGLAYGGQLGIRELQHSIERSFMGMFNRFTWRYRDPNRATTAIGSIGRLKFSDRILVRIKTDKPLTEPLYLREASYNSYGFAIWTTGTSDYTLIDPDIGGARWTINDTLATKEADIHMYMVKESGVIPVPQSTNKIKGKGIIEIKTNPFGAVILDMREGWVRYAVDYDDSFISESPPTKDDLKIGDPYKAVFDRLANELQLDGMNDSEAVKTIKEFFAGNFHYSLNRKQRFPRGKFLANFLFKNRQGHCEFFATSTVLLLRNIGIPARYAVGYATQEYSALERQYIARSRHAHSWTLAFVDNRWIRIDTTPSVWAPIEDEQASGFQTITDIWSWISFNIALLQTADELEDEEVNYNLLWLLIPLGLILAWSLYFKKREQTTKNDTNYASQLELSGKDSAFYRLVSPIESLGYPRRTGETLYDWINRNEKIISTGKIFTALKLHYQYRFDPHGLSERSKQEFELLVEGVLRDLRSA